ncbi:Uncharacterised protein [Pasteurella multocida]|nr:Uncharacterised protein [Pasteurella multocida]
MDKLTRLMIIARTLVLNPVKGISEKESYFDAHFLNARNEVSELERRLGIELHREREKSPIGNLYTRYTLKDKDQARKVVELFNLKLRIMHLREQNLKERLLDEDDIDRVGELLAHRKC